MGQIVTPKFTGKDFQRYEITAYDAMAHKVGRTITVYGEARKNLELSKLKENTKIKAIFVNNRKVK